MAVSAKWFGLGVKGQWSATAANRVDWVTDTIKVALTTSTFVPDQDVHDFFNDVTNEVSGAGYTAGGVTLGSKTLTYDTATNETRLDAADAAWTTATFTTRIGVGYKDTGTSSTSPLIWFIDMGGDQTVNAANFTIIFDATGCAKITAS